MAMTEDQWTPREAPLRMSSLINRVDIARVAAYEVFAEEKSENDFYLENLLNVFVALAQYPVSFVILKSNNLALKPIFHFCLDKSHYTWFTQMVEAEACTMENTFSLFPGSLSSEYRIAVVYMQTKLSAQYDRCVIIRRPSSIEEYLDKRHSETHGISHHLDYLSWCAYMFFEDRWFGFKAMFANEAKVALETSIRKLSAAYSGNPKSRKWPEVEKDVLKDQGSVHYPNFDKSAWKNRVNESLSQFIEDSRFGMRVITSIANVPTASSKKILSPDAFKTGLQPPNVMIAYRTFDRLYSHGNTLGLRHNDQNLASGLRGYSYNVRFVTPTHTTEEDGQPISSDPYINFLRVLSRLKKTGDHFSQKQKSYFDLVQEQVARLRSNQTHSRIDSSRINEDKLDRFVTIARWSEREFWKLLENEDGIETLGGAISKEVGSFSRSMADPVFSTGLIHINQAFELGGLDRILFSKISSEKTFRNLDKDVQSDLLRIVATYYYFSGSAAWSLRSPSNGALCTMLLPIKMRGSVWGVTIHAFYIDNGDYEHMFQQNNTWLSNFLLATSGRQKFQNRIDGILWGRAQRRVLRLLMKEIGCEESAEGFDDAIQRVNDKLQGEQLLCPYALPKFTWDVTEVKALRDWGDECWSVYHELEDAATGDKSYLRLTWTIAKNRFFTARQPWSRKGTRGFYDVVDLGLKRGMEQLVANVRAKGTQTHD